MNYRLSILTLSLLACFEAAVASPKSAVFKQEIDGKVVYSSKPLPNSQVAKLPELGRWKIQESPKGGVTCDKHGGVDCSKGADKDGSVLCRDGFKDALTPFNENCTLARLEALGEPARKDAKTVTIAFRNNRSVAAHGVKVEYHPNKFDPAVILEGTDSIEPFGIAEYTLTIGEAANVPKLSQIVISCANCQ